MIRYLNITARARVPRSGTHWYVRVVIDGRSGPERSVAAELAVVRFEARSGQLVRVDMRDTDAAGRSVTTYTRSLILGDSLPQNTMSDTIWLELADA